MTDNSYMGVVGATGRTGVHVVTQALQRGHKVTALARNQDKADQLLPNDVEVELGDATDPAAVGRLVADVDMVLDVSGPVKGGVEGYRTISTRTLLSTLDEHGGDHVGILHLTGAGVRQPGDRPGLLDKAVRGLMMLTSRKLLEDSVSAVEAINTANRPSLVVRCPRLTDGPATGSYTRADGVGPDSGIRITRADLATAILDLAEQSPWPTTSPVISA